MSMKLVACSDREEWDAFVMRSPQGNVFCRTAFLDALEVDYELWWVEEAGHRRLGAVVLKDETGQPYQAPVDLSLYHGVLWDEGHSRLPVHRRLREALETMNFLLEELKARYHRISFCLHPRTEDIRSFLWFHYHEPDQGQFRIVPRYTGVIDFGPAGDFDAYVATIRHTRRYEYRKALHAGVTVEPANDFDALDVLYRRMFERQDITVHPSSLRHVRAVASTAMSRGFGELLLCRSASGEPASATLFLYDHRCGYYLIGANDPAFRNIAAGTFVLLESLRRCHARGLRRVDVCGMNSPNRGGFKASFNAAPVLYFVATWEDPR